MGIYSKIYNNLCFSRCQSNKWKKGSGIHRHHIIPKHSGGSNEESNYCYLTIREHIIAHFLLWKIYKNPNDLRSMKMLGANLSYDQRKIVGEWCRDNKIGFHGATKTQRLEWSKKGLETQKSIENSWYYWSTEEGRKKRASLGGKIGGKKQAEQKIGIHHPDIQKIARSLGGKSHVGKVWINKDNKRTRVLKSDLEKFLKDGWVRGTRITSCT